MKNLSKEEKELILDFYFRCGDQESIDRGRDLIASSAGAARLYAGLEDTLTQLDSIKYEPCPDNLVELTVAKLKLAAGGADAHLKDLLEQEREKTVSQPSEKTPSVVKIGWSSFWRNIAEVAAVAAAILLVTGIGLPTLSSMRQRAWQKTCAANIKNTGFGLARYTEDNDGRFPFVVSAGSPWWKVGNQGSQNHSNTRGVWLLVKNGYVRGSDLVCPGHRQSEPVTYDSAVMGRYNDFPSRKNVSFSFRFVCSKTDKRGNGQTIIMADLNPVFADILSRSPNYDIDEFNKLWVDEQLKIAASPNHHMRGQNILWCDGSVRFVPQRVINGDDIFTVRNVYYYSGREVPCDDNDVFLVP